MKKYAILLALPLIFAWCSGASSVTWWDYATKSDIQKLQSQIDEIKATKAVSAELTPLEAVIVSNDKELAWKMETIKQNLFKNLKYEVVSSDSEEWKELINRFEVKYLPMMVVWDAIKSTEIWQYLWQLATEKDGQYNVDLASIAGQMRVDIQKEFLSVPDDLEFDWVKWPDNAKVTIIEVSDFECPFCSKFFTETYWKIVEEYWDRIQFRFKNLPLWFHQNAQKSAESAQCANKQWKFWEMHDKLFANNKELSEDNYKKWAWEIWLDLDTFTTCLDNWETADEVKKQAEQVWSFWIQWTPWFFINDKFLGWAYPFDAFKKIIDEELAKASSE